MSYQVKRPLRISRQQRLSRQRPQTALGVHPVLSHRTGVYACAGQQHRSTYGLPAHARRVPDRKGIAVKHGHPRTAKQDR